MTPDLELVDIREKRRRQDLVPQYGQWLARIERLIFT